MYADIFRRPRIKRPRRKFSRIRRTQKSNFLLEVRSSNQETVERYQDEVVEILGQQAEIIK